MAGSRATRKSGARKPRKAPARRTARPVLGNDPFERGAAPRPPARPEPPAAPKLAAVPATPAVPSPAPSPAQAPPAAPAPASALGSAVAAQAVALRSRIEALEARVESAATSAAERLGELARQEATGEHARDLLQAVGRLAPLLRERIGAVRALLAAPGEVDALGLERGLVERARPLLEFLYASWWRVEPRQLERVPSHGPVMIVANHGGALPWDALVLRMALLRDHPAHRELRPLLDAHALRVGGPLAVRLGAVPATPENALRLLQDGRAVAAFPEGSRSGLRPWPQRYRIERFGRGGFARLALRTGAAVVPCAIVGSEETSAAVARPGWLSDRLGLPPLLGGPWSLAALGTIPLPSRWSLRFGEPIATRDDGPEAADDPGRVLALTERTRAAIQQMLDEDVAARRSVYL